MGCCGNCIGVEGDKDACAEGVVEEVSSGYVESSVGKILATQSLIVMFGLNPGICVSGGNKNHCFRPIMVSLNPGPWKWNPTPEFSPPIPKDLIPAASQKVQPGIR